MMIDPDQDEIETTAPDTAPAPVDNRSEDDEDAAMIAAIRENRAKDDEADGAEEAKSSADRDPDTGKFRVRAKLKETNAEAVEAQPADAEPAQEKPAVDLDAVPVVSDAHRDVLKNLPDDVRAAVVEMHQETLAAASETVRGLQGYIDNATPYLKAISDNSDYLDMRAQELKLQPEQIISNLMGVDNRLRYGSFQEKSSLLLSIAKSYGVPIKLDLDSVSDDPFAAEYYPQQHDAQVERDRLLAENARLREAQEQASEKQVGSEISQWAAEKDSDGNLKRPLVSVVGPALADLLERNPSMSLDQAYDLATKPIMDLIGKNGQASATSPTADQVRAAGMAKKAAALNVKGRGGGSDGPIYESEDEAMLAAIRENRART